MKNLKSYKELNESKASQIKFEQEAKEIILELGGVETDGLYKYSFETKVGNLNINIYDGWIAMKFDEPKKAKEMVDCNPFSGKWNIHLDHESAILELDDRLNSVKA